MIREATLGDVEATFQVRARTRENPISRERLATLGITPASVALAMTNGSYRSWVTEVGGEIVGFCNADAGTGEVVVLAVLPQHEGHGWGAALLATAVSFLRSQNQDRIWLFASPLKTLRSHGFYRANGWSPTGRLGDNGDEELVYVGAGHPGARASG
jgi:ribosomal protein S18 acetylase RimI-like enzyme